MPEYIEREALIKLMQANFRQGSRDGCDHPMYPVVEETIMDAPTITPENLVKHGEIIETIEDGKMKRVFSCCGTDFTRLTSWITPNYCPNCGAKMNL